MFVLYDIQHLEGGFDSSFSLVSIQSSGTQQAILIMPGDDRLYQGISAAARRDSDLIVCQNGERTIQILLIDIAQGLDKGVVLTVSHSTAIILVTIDFDLDIGTWLQSIGGRNNIADEQCRAGLPV